MTQILDFRFTLMGACLLVSACSDYEIKLNDRALYTPVPLFERYHLQDTALNTCIRQTIADKRVSKAEELGVLVCTNAGITSLAGLGTFGHIEQLNLANNAISDTEELKQLDQLRRLDLSNNMIEDVQPLQMLAHLEEVNLRGNPALDCAGANRLEELVDATVKVAKHCDGDAAAVP